MASNNSPLLTPSQTDLSHISTQRTETTQVPGTHNTNTYDPLVPNAIGSHSRDWSTASSSTAYEPNHLESGCRKHRSINEPSTIRASTSSWALEIIAIIISTSALIAIVALLHRENGRSLASWTFVITLNTIVAALGTLARTSLAFAISACVGQQKWTWFRRKPDGLVAWERFDEASRGPWGGVRLFVWLRARHWAALGALVTVGAIAFDPFLQAVISTYGQMDIHSATMGADATIGRSLRIDSGMIMGLQGGGAQAEITSTGQLSYFMTIDSRPDFGFISSVYNGFQNTSSFRNDAIGARCSSGNCTWPLFTSAAVCSACEDVSSHMDSMKRYGSKGSNIPMPNMPYDIYKGEFVEFTLPYGNIRNYIGPVLNAKEEQLSPAKTYMTANTTFEANRTISFQHMETLLMAFLVMRAPEDWLESRASWEDSTPTATECALYLCANAYESRSENSIVREHVLGSWAHKSPDSYKVNRENSAWGVTPANNSGAEGWIESLGSRLYDARVNRTDLQLIIPRASSADFPDNMTREFNVSHNFIFSAVDFLIDYTKAEELTNGLPVGSNNGTTPDETWNMLAVPWQTDRMPPVVDALWNSTNLTTTFDNVARSLTNQIRNASPDRHQGQLQRWVIHVHVDWAYLAYPVSMLVAGIVYVILTIIESTRLRMPAWKESALPTLLHGFDDETQRLLRGCGNKAAQRKVLVRFEQDETGCLRLVAQQ